MHLDLRSTPRRAALTVEAAFIYPLMIFLLLALIIGGVGVLRYQQVACQAAEAARYACVRGRDYAAATRSSSPGAQQIVEQAVLPVAAGMDTTELSVDVQWIDASTGATKEWDQCTRDVYSTTPGGEYVSNKVRVTVRYRWTPNFLGLGSLYLTNTCELPMAF
jgi:Flp pilus assembly protein TadG